MLLGAAAVVAVLASWAPSGAQSVAGTTVSLTMNRTATLEITPTGQILATSLQPAAARTAQVGLRNIGERPSQVRLRIEPVTGEADPYLGFEIRTDGRRVFRGPLGALRSWTGTAIHLRSGQAVRLTIRVALLDTLPAAAELPEQALTIDTLEQPWAR